jgi:hypothetical protein
MISTRRVAATFFLNLFEYSAAPANQQEGKKNAFVRITRVRCYKGSGDEYS